MNTNTLATELPDTREAYGANTLTPELLHKMNAYWRAANYDTAMETNGSESLPHGGTHE